MKLNGGKCVDERSDCCGPVYPVPRNDRRPRCPECDGAMRDADEEAKERHAGAMSYWYGTGA